MRPRIAADDAAYLILPYAEPFTQPCLRPFSGSVQTADLSDFSIIQLCFRVSLSGIVSMMGSVPNTILIVVLVSIPSQVPYPVVTWFAVVMTGFQP